MTTRERAEAVRAAASEIDAAIREKGGETPGGLRNAAAAIAALPSGGGVLVVTADGEDYFATDFRYASYFTLDKELGYTKKKIRFGDDIKSLGDSSNLGNFPTGRLLFDHVEEIDFNNMDELMLQTYNGNTVLREISSEKIKKVIGIFNVHALEFVNLPNVTSINQYGIRNIGENTYGKGLDTTMVLGITNPPYLGINNAKFDHLVLPRFNVNSTGHMPYAGTIFTTIEIQTATVAEIIASAGFPWGFGGSTSFYGTDKNVRHAEFVDGTWTIVEN